MTRPRRVEQVGDLKGGEIVRLVDGMYRITHRPDREGVRWAIPLRPDGSETSEHVWLRPNIRVLEVLEQRQPVVEDQGEVDPLLAWRR